MLSIPLLCLLIPGGGGGGGGVSRGNAVYVLGTGENGIRFRDLTVINGYMHNIIMPYNFQISKMASHITASHHVSHMTKIYETARVLPSEVCHNQQWCKYQAVLMQFLI